MKYLVRLFVTIFAFFYISLSSAEISIVFVNMEKVKNQSKAGKSITLKLEEIHKGNIKLFKETEESLKKEENDIIQKKNILSNEEYNKKIELLRQKVAKYRKNRQDRINSINQKKMEASSKLLKALNPILSQYSKDNQISLILQKKNIVLGKTDLDITNKIIEIADAKIKSISLD